jgi:hypothetical protein
LKYQESNILKCKSTDCGQNFQHQTTLPLSLENFISLNHLSIETIYKKDSWSRLCQRAGVIDDFESINEKTNLFSYWKKWLSTNSTSYFNFILNIAKSGFIILNDFNENEKKIMLCVAL